MTGLNNFVTDLLDQMISTGAGSLELQPHGNLPIAFVYDTDTKHAVHIGRYTDETELLEDLEALGFSTDAGYEAYFYDYKSEAEQETISLKCNINKIDGSVKVSFSRSSGSSIIVGKALEKTNPVKVNKVMSTLDPYIFGMIK